MNQPLLPRMKWAPLTEKVSGGKDENLPEECLCCAA